MRDSILLTRNLAILSFVIRYTLFPILTGYGKTHLDDITIGVSVQREA